MNIFPTVLLVEDEWLIADAISKCLSDAGFKVIAIARAEAALLILKEAASPVGAIITDVRLGRGMDGLTLAHEVTRRWPSLLLMIVSGESAERLAGRPASCGFIPKPCEPEAILTTLQTMITQQEASASRSPNDP